MPLISSLNALVVTAGASSLRQQHASFVFVFVFVCFFRTNRTSATAFPMRAYAVNCSALQN